MSWPKTRSIWIDRRLTCMSCGKRTFRPLESTWPCDWCEGKLL